MTKFTWDEYDGEVIDGVRYANSFTANMAKNSKLIGAAEERERIIKLLETKSECKPQSGHDWNGDCYCEVIALIKGENK